MVKLLIVDNHAQVREALERRLSTAVGMEIVGSTGSYEDALHKAVTFAPDVVLMETKAHDGIDTLRTLCQLLPESAIIVLTSFPVDMRLAASLELPPESIVRKSHILTELPEAVGKIVA